MKTTGWKFPRANGGAECGHNDAGISTFEGDRMSSLAREIIQNSMDAKADKATLVRVEFKVFPLPAGEFPGREQYLKIFKQCLKRCQETQADGLDFYKSGVKILQDKQIQFLMIADYNTTGLTDNPNLWDRLVKKSGDSGKSEIAGGSYGIGKSAPFAASNLRTVFYSTKYAGMCKSQGRAALLSHKDDGGKITQGTGFYGSYDEDNCDPIPEKEMPGFLTRNEQGTTIGVAGFNPDSHWKTQIEAAVVTNFFVAIEEGKLEVSIEDVNIKQENLSERFEQLSNLPKLALTAESQSNLQAAQHMYKAMKQGVQRDFQLNALGHCKIWVLAEKEMPKEVGIVRNTGMIITRTLKGLQRFPGIGDFMAICICSSEKGNRLLRRMENPQHNQFEPGRLDKSGGNTEVKMGENALDELARKVRGKIKEVVASDEAAASRIDELSKFFPDVDDASDGEGKGEPDFEQKLIITKKRRSTQSHRAPDEEKGDDNDDIPESEHENGNGGGGGGGDKKKTRQTVPVHKVRVVKHSDTPGMYKVSFIPRESGTVQLAFKIAGDQKIDDLPLKSDCQKRAKNVEVNEGQRTEFILEAKQNIEGAIRVEAYMPILEASASKEKKQ